jgi:competence protein ComGC
MRSKKDVKNQYTLIDITLSISGLWVFIISLLLLIFIQPIIVKSQDTLVKNNEAESNIIDLSDKLDIHFYGKKKVNSFSFSDNKNGENLLYSPNEQLNIGFGFNYKWLGIGVALNFSFINNDDYIYGNTHRLDLQMNAYGKKFVTDFTLGIYNSFYLKNSSEIMYNSIYNNEYYIRPDINSVSFGVSSLYVFNHKRFSYKAAFVSTAIQKKSAGSFYVGPQFIILGINADSSFFPSHSKFDSFPDFKTFTRVSIGVLGGYAYNFIIAKKFYISISFGMALSNGRQMYNVGNTEYLLKNVVSVDFLPRVAFGFNNERYYGGFSTFGKLTGFDALKSTENLGMTFNYSNYRFFIGKRFNLKRDNK